MFKPLFEADFSEVSELIRYTSDDVFRHYGASRHMLPSETLEYVKDKRKAWQDAEWFEYIVKFDGDYIGMAHLNAHSGLDAYEFGFWLQKDYWGRGFSQERADAFMHVVFELLDASYMNVGTVIQNDKSRRSIEKYIHRYGGSFYGCAPRSDAVYHPPVEDPTDVIAHPEWVVTQSDYRSEESGISTLIPGVSYDDVEF